MNAKWLLMLGLAALTAWPVLAADETPPPKEEPPKEEGKVAPGQAKQVSRLVSEFGVTEAEVKGLRDKGMGWGEIRHALAISRKSGKPLSEIVAMRDSGKGWGQIGKDKGAPSPVRGGGRGNPRGHGGGPKR